MCTAATYKTKDFYFGRTLDYECSYGEKIVFTPQNYRLKFREEKEFKSHYAILGMAAVYENFPLYYDAMNEKGLCMAGLNFVGNAHYQKKRNGKENIAQFEFILWILCQCQTVQEARKLLENINLLDTPFNDQLPVAQLHWILADQSESITIEAVKEGLKVYDNPVGVLTNNPPFDMQMMNLNQYMNLSPNTPKNLFSKKLNLKTFSRGMGAIGLPGDLSSTSRFVRVAFNKMNAKSNSDELSSVSQFFHILNSVEQTRGCCHLGNKKYEITIYTSCCNAKKGIYYYTTYDNHQITAISMHHENLKGEQLVCYPLFYKEQINWQN